jgi:hypothetical protein
MRAPSTLIRWLLFALLAAAVGGALLLALLSVDTALSVWDRLQGVPKAFRYLYVGLLSTAALATAWLGWRLLRPRGWREGPTRPPVVTREAIEQRATRLAQAGASRDGIDAELADLDRRAASGELHVALFGAVNAGKSALVRALAPDAEAVASDVLGGTTRVVSHHRGILPGGIALVLADVPGTQEDPAREAAAREEALRAHWVLYVCAGDLSRQESAEVQWLKSFDKPFAIVLNQVDRYDERERKLLIDRLRERCAADVVAVSAGGVEAVEIRAASGSRREWRARTPEIENLQRLLARRLERGPAAFEPARGAAVLRGLDQRISRVEAERRAVQADAVIGKYTRRAVIGALAAVAPGSDLVIQGALGTALVRELAGIYETPVRQIDIDALIERAGGTLRTTTAVILAIAGNAAKAFPGFGTIGGGLAHSVAYGMIFDSLGRAVAATLAAGDSLASDAVQNAFDERLRVVPASRLLSAVKSALGEAVAERDARKEISR